MLDTVLLVLAVCPAGELTPSIASFCNFTLPSSSESDDELCDSRNGDDFIGDFFFGIFPFFFSELI